MPHKIIQWATGEVGTLCLREIIRRPELQLVGLRVYSPDKDGRDAGEIAGGDPIGVAATTDRQAIIDSDADCVIHAPLAANMQELDDDVVALLESGKNVISTAAYFAPEFRGPEIAARLQAACEEGGTTLTGTGVEPGFMFERVMPTLTGMCTDVDSIRLVEVIDAANHPAATMILEALGIGKPLEEVTKDSPFGQYFCAFFSEMATASARALGVEFDSIEAGVDVAPASRDLDIAVGKVAKGTVAGDCYWVNGIVDGKTFMRVEIYWLVEPGVIGWPAPADRYQWHTELYDASGFSDHVQSRRSYRLAMMAPETVAREAYAAVMAGRRQIVHGAHHRLMAAALLHLPLPVRRALAVKTSGDIEPNADPLTR